MQDTIIKPTNANSRLRDHGFRLIHSAIIKTNPRGSKHPMALQVTGTWKPAGDPTAPLQIATRAVAQGTIKPLQRFALVNNLPIQKTPDL
jgi:hypothetical protein